MTDSELLRALSLIGPSWIWSGWWAGDVADPKIALNRIALYYSSAAGLAKCTIGELREMKRVRQ